MGNKKKKAGKKLTAGIVTMFTLLICLTITTYAIVYATLSVENNLFHSGIVDINLNDGKPVIEEHEFLFEPGMTVEKDFFIKNNSTWDVYYKLYFSDVEGGLADFLEITILDGDKILWSGIASEMTRKSVGAADESLRIQEKKDLTIRFHFPEESGNAGQNLELSFTFCADAVQTKNNPNKLFD